MRVELGWTGGTFGTIDQVTALAEVSIQVPVSAQAVQQDHDLQLEY
ncbi:hypothetical protein ACWCP8_22775 [Streptomyces sp. NPDC002206]